MRRVIQWPSLYLPSHPTLRTINLISSVPVPGREQPQPQRPHFHIPQFQELLTQLSEDYQENVPDDTLVSHTDFPSSASCLTNITAGLPMVIVASADCIVSSFIFYVIFPHNDSKVRWIFEMLLRYQCKDLFCYLCFILSPLSWVFTEKIPFFLLKF